MKSILSVFPFKHYKYYLINSKEYLIEMNDACNKYYNLFIVTRKDFFLNLLVCEFMPAFGVSRTIYFIRSKKRWHKHV